MGKKAVFVEETELYTGTLNGPYTKQKANLFVCDADKGMEDPNKKVCGYVKAEPIMDGKKKLMGWMWYAKGPYKPTSSEIKKQVSPKYFGSLRFLMEAVNDQYKEDCPDAAPYEPSQAFLTPANKGEELVAVDDDGDPIDVGEEVPKIGAALENEDADAA